MGGDGGGQVRKVDGVVVEGRVVVWCWEMFSRMVVWCVRVVSCAGIMWQQCVSLIYIF